MPPKTRSKIAEEETPASKTAGKRRGRPSALARPHTEPPRRRKKRTKTANSSPTSPSTPLRGPRMVANRLSPSPPQQSRSSQRMRRMEEQLAILSNAVLAGMHNQQATQSAWHMTPSVSASPSLPRARCPPTLSPAWPPTNLPRRGIGEVRAAAETAPANFQRHPQDPIASTHSLTVTTTAPAQVPHTVGMAPLPPPDRLIADPTVAGQVMAALQTLNPAAPCTGGKKAAKPYMYVEHRFKPKNKKDQKELSFPLMCHGMMGLILAALPSKDTPVAAMCQHMKEVAEDTISRPWPAVREWSNTVFDRLDKGDITWANYDEIQRDRYKLSFSAPPLEQQQTPCQAFNFRSCPNSDSHEEGPVTLRHWCGFCMFASNTHSMHTVRQCNSKKASTIVTTNKPGKYPPRPKPDQPKN